MAFDAREFLARQLATPPVPSKRTVKNRSGRSSRKAANGQAALAAVGGFRSTVKAIYAPADFAMCQVVPHETGYREGLPFRSPE